MEIVDKSTWARREAFESFSGLEYPFYAVTMPLDITNVKAAAKAKGVSFYHLLIWVCTKAINSLPEYRIRIRGEQVVRLDETIPCFSDLQKDSEQFRVIALPWEADMLSFCRHAREKCLNQVEFSNSDSDTDAVIYYSCLPWFDFTALTNEHSLNKDDSIPRLAWGKYYEENGRLMVHLSVEVNHRLIDGYHIGKLKMALDREIEALAAGQGQ